MVRMVSVLNLLMFPVQSGMHGGHAYNFGLVDFIQNLKETRIPSQNRHRMNSHIETVYEEDVFS